MLVVDGVEPLREHVMTRRQGHLARLRGRRRRQGEVRAVELVVVNVRHGAVEFGNVVEDCIVRKQR